MDDSSSDDNLFDVNEWDHTKSVFNEDEKQVPNKLTRMHRINSVSHTLDRKSYSQQKLDPICQALKHEMELTNISIQTNNEETFTHTKYSTYSPSTESMITPSYNSNMNSSYYDEYNPKLALHSKSKSISQSKSKSKSMRKQCKPKIIPPLKASKTDRFKNNISSHAFGSNLLFNDIIDEMTYKTNLKPLAEPDDDNISINSKESIDSLVKYINDIYDKTEKEEKQQMFLICNCIQNCQALKRIIACLDFYDNITGEMNDRNGIINEYFVNYTQFLNDYYHILHKHLNNNTKIENDKNYKLIYNKVSKYIQCNFKKCDAYLRNNKQRDDENIYGETGSEGELDLNIEFYIDILDSIHCILLHSYDIGCKVNATKLMECTMNSHSQIDNKSDSFYNDEELKQLNKYLIEKKRQLWLIKGNAFMKMNKFNNNLFLNGNSLDKFGQKFYFWDYYKNNNEMDNIYNFGYKYCDWYIEYKYDNLKHELSNNKNGHQLNHKQYNRSYLKALNYMNTIYIKKIIKTENNFENYLMKNKIFEQQNINNKLYYGINNNQLISVEHILALIFYTDYVQLPYFFRNSFYIFENETIDEFKQRKREYWHWSKLIAECIEIYGEWISNSKYDTYYTGICHTFICNSLNANFVAPISVTSCLSITSMYCDNNKGNILELSTNTNAIALFVKQFNCNFLSCFPYESELLFGECINMKSLKITSIRCIKKYENYICFIRAINMFDKVLNGQRIYLFNDKTPKMDYKIIDKLVSNKIGENKNKYPKKINDIFYLITNNIKCIKLNIYNINTMYCKLKEYFISYLTSNVKDNNMCDIVLFKTLTNICPYVEEINVEMCDKRNIMTPYVLNILLSSIANINITKLKLIKLINIENECYDKDFRLFKYNINSINWDVTFRKKK